MTLGKLTSLMIGLAVVGYIGFHVVNLRRPPTLTLSQPPQGLTTSAHVIEIQGQTSPGARVEINGTPLPPGKAGRFQHTLAVNDGLNTILVRAQKRYSRPRQIERQIFILGESKISKTVSGGI